MRYFGPFPERSKGWRGVFRTICRKISPNPLELLLKRSARGKKKKILLCWNRGLGDIALGLYAVVERIREYIPDAAITFLTRKNLVQGFQLLRNVRVIEAPGWERGVPISVEKTLRKLKISPSSFDLIIEKPDPTYWVKWQLGKLCPKLRWKKSLDSLHTSFRIPEKPMVIGIHPLAEAAYGLSRNWPYERWKELFDRLQMRKDLTVLLFGLSAEMDFSHSCLIDLRMKTELFQMLSIIKNRCTHLIVPDSGILSMTYFLDVSFPIKVISLWSDSNQGILKQGVASPNPQLIHVPLLAEEEDLHNIQVDDVLMHLFPQIGRYESR
jgi:ADP-heptose:LPS heptosyltransferase